MFGAQNVYLPIFARLLCCCCCCCCFCCNMYQRKWPGKMVNWNVLFVNSLSLSLIRTLSTANDRRICFYKSMFIMHYSLEGCSVFSIHWVHASLRLCVWVCLCINVQLHKIYTQCMRARSVLSFCRCCPFLLPLLLPLWLSYSEFGFLANGNTLYKLLRR